MKKIYFIWIPILILSIGFHSCTQEDDILGDGDARDAFIGEWSVTDACNKQTYRSVISIDENNSSHVRISNFANLGKSAEAIIAGSSIYIESQEIGNGYTVSGNGRINGEIISWTSHSFETDGSFTDCTATYSIIK